MKFRDIQPFTRTPSYQVNVPLTHLQKTIDDFILNDGLNVSPDFQRHHVWDIGKREAFIEFILRGGSSSKTLYFNHPGWRHSHVGEFVIVDGKQRLTSLLMFLNNEIRAFGTYYKDFEDRLDSLTNIIISINDLQTQAEVLQWYLDINSSGVIHTKKEIQKVRNLLKDEKKKLKIQTRK